MVLVILGKIKVEDRSFEEIYNRALVDPHDRIKKFYEISNPLIGQYIQYCIKKSYLDFNDLMMRGVLLLSNNKEIEKTFNEKGPHTYYATVIDPSGNTAKSATTSFTVS